MSLIAAWLHLPPVGDCLATDDAPPIHEPQMLRTITSLALFLLLNSVGQLSAEQWDVASPTADALRNALSQLEMLRESGDRSPSKIVLAAGTYRLDQPIVLSPTLVGEGLTIESAKAGQAVLTGAVPLTPLDPIDGRWRYALPPNPEPLSRPRVIIVGGKLRTAARHPNVGYNRIEASAPDRRSGFRFREQDLPASLDLAIAPCDLVFLHDWSSSRLPIAQIDTGRTFLTTVGPIGCRADHFAMDHFEAHPRYFLEGHPALADSAGEWFIDESDNELVIVAGTEDQSPEVELPLLEQLIRSDSSAAPIQSLRFIGVTFAGTRFPMPAGGLAAAQATMHEPRGEDGIRQTDDRPMLSAAVHLDQPAGCSFSKCRFRAIGNTALCIGSRAVDCVVQDCTFDDIGGNAVNVGEDHQRKIEGRNWYESAPEQVPTNNRIAGCVLSRCGVVLPGSVAIWAALNKQLEISGNTISDCPYTGISLGWIWNDRPSPAAENDVHDNQITRVMQVLSDGGGVYTLGRQPGSRIASNSISNIPLNAGRAESNGLFLDEGTTGFTIEDNEFRRIARSPLRFHQAGKNVVHSNRWELETDDTPPVRYNNTPEENIHVGTNTVLSRQKRIYLIGNSLTWDTRPPLLDDYVDWHVDCGKSLRFIFDHPQNPCVGSSHLWPIALQQLQYDYLSVQPHYGTTLEQDVDVISSWMELQPNAVVVIHCGWARSATAADEYAQTDGTEMGHRPGYFTRLISALQARFPDRAIRQSFTTDALHAIAADIDSGKSPLNEITDLYRDAIHMTHAEGRYLMHNLMRAAVDQPPSTEGFTIGQTDPSLKDYLDQIIRRTVKGPQSVNP